MHLEETVDPKLIIKHSKLEGKHCVWNGNKYFLYQKLEYLLYQMQYIAKKSSQGTELLVLKIMGCINKRDNFISRNCSNAS